MTGTTTEDVERLASLAESYVIVLDGEHHNIGLLIRALAARVERLEETLHSIAANSCCEYCREAGLWAKAALKEGSHD